MRGEPLQVDEKFVLVVTVTSDLKLSDHCRGAREEADFIFGFIARSFRCMTPEVMLTLYSITH